MRLLVSKDGIVEIESFPFAAAAKDFNRESSKLTIALDSQSVSSQDLFLRHKTTHRTAYESARFRSGVGSAFGEPFDVLLFNERHEITECCIANVAVLSVNQDCWITPPVSSGLLPGVMRRHLLLNGLENLPLIERVVTVADLKQAVDVSALLIKELIYNGINAVNSGGSSSRLL